MLRDPVRRIASWLRFSKAKGYLRWGAAELPFLLGNGSHLLSDVQTANLDNMHVRCLTGMTHADGVIKDGKGETRTTIRFGEVGERLLSWARSVLTHFEVVLVLEELSQPWSIAQLQHVLGGVLPSEVLHLNPTSAESDPYAPLGKAEVSALRELNRYDAALYAEARETSRKRGTLLRTTSWARTGIG